jgi:CRP-like cAMP-binding protein
MDRALSCSVPSIVVINARDPVHWIQIISYIGSGFAAVALLMTRMIPLRLMIIVSNVAFIMYGALAQEYVITVLHAVLLPLNAWRLRQMRTMIAKVEQASSGAINMEWLTTFMRRRQVGAGEILFSRGDEATEMYYIVSGRYRVPELLLDLAPGAMVGEVGLIAPERKRSQSLQCLEAGELLSISYDEVHELYFQNPEFGYHFLRLITGRLFNDLRRLESELAARAKAARTQ